MSLVYHDSTGFPFDFFSISGRLQKNILSISLRCLVNCQRIPFDSSLFSCRFERGISSDVPSYFSQIAEGISYMSLHFSCIPQGLPLAFCFKLSQIPKGIPLDLFDSVYRVLSPLREANPTLPTCTSQAPSISLRFQRESHSIPLRIP